MSAPAPEWHSQHMELLESAPPDVAGHSAARYIDLDDDSSSPRRARLFVDEASRDWGCDAIRDDAVLVASELVGNAVGHARTSCRLDIWLDALGLTIAVRDYDSRGLLVPLTCSATGHRDHGLFLIASICRAWGVSPTENGKSVWALLPIPER
jgi:Histidine kinase-like ATPase domain